MKELLPINQTKLIGLNRFFNELINLEKRKIFPNKILLSGPKGIGKCTLAFHFINYVLSRDEQFKYDELNLEINERNQSFKTVLNKSNLNFFLIDIDIEKKFIDIGKIRGLISYFNKSSFNQKPRFVLIDNIEYLNLNSINALLKILEEPTENTHFILINNNKKVLPTLSSRCINFKVNISNSESLKIINGLLKEKLHLLVHPDFINYYISPGNIFNLIRFSELNSLDLSKMNLKDFLNLLIDKNFYKKDNLIQHLIFELLELYFYKIRTSLNFKVFEGYDSFIKKVSDTKKFNLDEDFLFMEFKEKVLNG